MTQHISHKILKQKQVVQQYLDIADDWGLSDEETFDLSNLVAFDTLQLWRYGIFPLFDDDIYEHLSAIITLNHFVKRCFKDTSNRRLWLRSSPDTFFGKPPLEYMLSGHRSTINDVSKRLILRIAIALTS